MKHPLLRALNVCSANLIFVLTKRALSSLGSKIVLEQGDEIDESALKKDENSLIMLSH